MSKLAKVNVSYADEFHGAVCAHQDGDIAARSLAYRGFHNAGDDANLFAYRASRDEPYGV